MSRIIFLALLLISTKQFITLASDQSAYDSMSYEDKPGSSIIFTPGSASQYIQELILRQRLWRHGDDTLRASLARLIDQFYVPYDTAKKHLINFDFDAITTSLEHIVESDTLPVRWLNHNSFIIDTVRLKREPIIKQKTIIVNPIIETPSNSGQDPSNPLEYIPHAGFSNIDTVFTELIDTLLLRQNNLQLFQIINDRISPPLTHPDNGIKVEFTVDSSHVILYQTFRAIVANKESPFFILQSERMPDSLRTAVKTLLSYTEARDSVLIFFETARGNVSPYWLSTRERLPERLWIKNSANDSIFVWLSNPAKYNLNLSLEDNVLFQRRTRKSVDHISFTSVRPQYDLVAIPPLTEIPVYWNFGLASSFTLNQTSHTNWARGGQNSMSGMLDISGTANFKDEKNRRAWNNSARLRYGAILTEEHGYRTNTDIIELNSQYNRKVSEKLNLSVTFYGRTQLAKGFNFPNDSVPVSKFLSPGTFTIGIGLDLTPFRETRINFAPLSYRNTFVLDTAAIDQTIHGIRRNKRARHEMGGQLVFRNTYNITEDLRMTNAIRLFSGYLHKPLNIDVDWELSLDMQISWYFAVRLNTHLIYDEDVLFRATDRNNNPVLNPDGSQRKVPKTQLRQLLGLTLSFRI